MAALNWAVFGRIVATNNTIFGGTVCPNIMLFGDKDFVNNPTILAHFKAKFQPSEENPLVSYLRSEERICKNGRTPALVITDKNNIVFFLRSSSFLWSSSFSGCLHFWVCLHI